MRLIVPTMNFTAAFSKLGYMGTKTIFEENEVVFDVLTIVQVSDLKNELKMLGLEKATTTIFSLDAVDMYPSIKYKLVEKAVKTLRASFQPK